MSHAHRAVPVVSILSALALAVLLLLALFAPIAAAQDQIVAPSTAAAPLVRVVAWNDLGMHCMDGDFSLFAILPPFNNVQAQVIVDGQLLTGPGSYSVTYRAVADSSGSINTTSVGKTDFWEHVEALFGATLAANQGLAGFGMPGAGNTPQAMAWDADTQGFIARGIPITPYDDAAQKNTYPMMRIEVRDASEALLASTDIVLPVSDEMSCRACHASGSASAAEPAAGWALDPDPLRDDRLNILRLHDELNALDPDYVAALASLGVSPDGLLASAVTDGRPVLCAACHASNALPGTGIAGITPLTEAMHGRHADVLDPIAGGTLDDADNRAACYRCHPGSETRCLRGAMGSAVAPDGSLAMQCQNCHGSMSAVGLTGRSGWLDQPGCGNCHSGTATDHDGQIRFSDVFDVPGHRRVPANTAYATNPNTPAAGFSLYRMSTGHGGLQCSACHGSTHAIFPSSHASDNVASLDAQGHVGELSDCTTCHLSSPSTTTGGPHGMHPVGQPWVSKHKSAAEGSTSNCRSCHGSDLRGTELSRALGPRTLKTELGDKTLWRGFTVSCWLCHDGPDGEGKTHDKAPVVKNAAVEVDHADATPIPLTATDGNGDSLSLRVVTQPQHGTVGLVGSTATYYPDGSYAGPEGFTFAAWDGLIESNLGSITLNVVDAACPMALSEASASFGVAGGPGNVLLSLPPECAWTVGFVGAAADWVSLTSPTSGSGDTLVSFEVAPNPGTASRSTTLRVGALPFLVQQAGSSGPDLAGTWSLLEQKCGLKSGLCKLRGTLLVTNVGDQPAGKTLLRFYLSADTTLDAGDLLLKEVKVKALKSGKTVKRKLKAKLPEGTTASGQFVLAVLDADGVLPEIDESDGVVASAVLP